MTTTPNGPAGGEQIVVELDEDRRLERVEVRSLEPDLRDSAALRTAFDVAWSSALERSRSPVAASAGATGTGPRTAAARGPLLTRPPLPSLTGREPHWSLIRSLSGRAGGPEDLSPTGASDNDCVHVRLDPASARGRLDDIDAGWLSQTTPDRLASAITEAFTHAYEKRTNR